MAAPKRPSRKGARGPKSGLPSSSHSDTSAIVHTILAATATPQSEPDDTVNTSAAVDAEDGKTPSTDAEQPPSVTSSPEVPPPTTPTVRVVARPGEAAWAPLHQFAHSPLNPRFAREYDPNQDPELARFTETVDLYGILQPVAVTSAEAWLQHHPDHAGEFEPGVRWVVILGNRRLASARAYGLDGLPYYRNDQLAVPGYGREAVLIENYHRRGLDPIREAAEMRTILEDSGQSVRALASRVGISHTQINQRLQLLDLIPEFQGMVSDLILAVQKALPLTRLHPDQQRALLELGPPYVPTRLQAAGPARAAPHPEQSAGRTTTSQVTIKRNSTPAQVADTLRTKLTPDILATVLELLRTDDTA